MGRAHSVRGSLTLTGNSKGLTMAPDPQYAPWTARLALARQGVTPKDSIPQELVDAWFEIATEAVKWFHDPDFKLLPALEYADGASDDEVRSRIAGFQKGYDKEYNRRAALTAAGNSGAWTDYYTQEELGERERYDFSQWPFWLQRTVVSHWDRLHYEYLAAHGLSYSPAEGYFWDIEGTHIPYLDTDKGKPPTERGADAAGFPYLSGLPYLG